MRGCASRDQFMSRIYRCLTLVKASSLTSEINECRVPIGHIKVLVFCIVSI